MNILELILNAQNGGPLKQLSQGFNLSSGQTQQILAELVPGLTKGIQQNVSNKSGLEGLMAALQKGNHQRYIDQPEVLMERDTTLDGNNILGHILGSKQASRNLASQVSERTGVSSGILKQMLPVIASMVMGSLSKQTATQSSASGLAGVLGGLLDADGDGSMADDLLGMASKFLR